MPTEETGRPGRAPDCLSCAYFRVTWDADFPRACDVFGIKSRNLPAYEVFAATGRHCPAYERKLVAERPRPEGGADPSAEAEGGIWA